MSAGGPGAKLLGSSHTANPIDVPIIRTDLEIKPVRIGAWADIGTNATILPGVTIGKGRNRRRRSSRRLRRRSILDRRRGPGKISPLA